MSFTKTRQRYSLFKRWLNHRLRIRKKLHVEVIDGPGDPIVFLHGIASNTKVWELVIKPLRGKHKLVLVDMLGFGESIAPDTIKYNVDDHVYAISHGLKKAGVKKPFHIVGHSMGSIVAAHFAAVHPKKVAGLVLCSLPIYKRSELSDQKLRSWQKATDEMYFRVYRILRQQKDFAVKTAAVLHKLGVREIELKEHSWYAFSESLKNTIEHQNVEADIKQIKVPINIIYGKFDILVISKHLEELKKYENVRVYKTNSRHDLTEGYSHKISQLIQRSVSAK